MANIDLVRKRDLTAFRKLSLGMWRTAYDPQIYGWGPVRMEQALEYIERFEKCYGKKLTVTQLVTKTVGEILRRHPELNALLRFNRIYLREHADVCLNVMVPVPETGRADLLTAKISDVDRKPLLEIANELGGKVARIRSGKDPLQRGPGPRIMRRVPGLLMTPLITTLSFLHYGLNLNLSWLGFPRDPFGSAQVTSLGSLGLSSATILGPLVPFTRMPLLVLFGSIHDAPVVEDGEIKVGRVMNVTFTVDHRFTDGSEGVAAISDFTEIMENPFEHFDPV
jgi:pyruvate dehydrogenase E2 component (dihydrolipoamide acetyltransferase)